MIPAGRICSRALPFALALVFTAASARAELAFSPDGSHLAVSAADNRGLMVLDIHRGALSTLTDTPSSGYAFNWSPDGTKLGFKVLHATRDGYLQEPSRTYPRTPNL
jgi:WD40 repeat protein